MKNNKLWIFRHTCHLAIIIIIAPLLSKAIPDFNQILYIHVGTYDVQRITFMSCLDETNGCVRIRTSFSTGSPAQGALLILLPQSRTEQSTPSQQEGYYLFIRQGLRDLIELREMVAGMYDVYLYDVEENGFVDSGPPAVRKAVSVSNTHGELGLYCFSLL